MKLLMSFSRVGAHNSARSFFVDLAPLASNIKTNAKRQKSTVVAHLEKLIVATRSSKLEIEKLLQTIMALMCQGANRQDILQFASERTEWRVSERSVDSYIERAREMIRSNADFDPAEEIGKARARYEDLYRNSHKDQDWKTCLSIQREVTEFLGVRKPIKLAQTDSQGNDLSRNAAESEIAGIARALAQRSRDDAGADSNEDVGEN